MAVFTKIATFVVGAFITGGATAAAAAGIFTATGLAVAAVSAGLAIATSRVIMKNQMGNFRNNSQAANDPGVRIQLPPSTDNRIPVFYGNVITSGIITHANISNENKTMTYVMVLSEETANTTYVVNKIYRNDQVLSFSAESVTGATDADGEFNSDIQGKIRVRVYAGGVDAGDQIFPTTGAVAAGTFAPVLATDGANMTGLVYAIYSQDYDAGNDLVSTGVISFDIGSSLSEPSAVLLDYLTSDRYGAGLSNSQIDLNSFADMLAYSTAQVDYTPHDSSTEPQDQWRIDGVLSTYLPVRENIDRICQSAATWFIYDSKKGQFAVRPNRAASNAELANAFVFSDNNIISNFDISTTELYNLYNVVEAEHPQYNQRDQTDVVYVEVPTEARNPNEPENRLTVRYDLVNDNSRAKNLANIDLRQSRFGTVLNFTADYSAIQCDVGDVVKVNNAVYGYDSELFRVLRVDEQSDIGGTLTARVVLLEYSDAIYDHEIVLQKAPPLPTGIPALINNNDIRDAGNVYVADQALDGFGNGVITPEMIDMFGLINADPIFSEFTSLNAELANLDITLSDNSNSIANLNIELGNLELALSDNTNAITELNTITLPGLESDLANNTNAINTLNTITLPGVESDLANNTNAINTLNTVTLPGVESDISNNTNAINTLNTITIPGVESDLSNNTNAINILNTVTLPGVESDLSNNTNAINTLNTVTLPGLELELANLEAELANIETANIDAYFPVTESNIANDSISSPKIITNAVITRHILAENITADKMAVNSVTANAILAGAVTAGKIAAGTVTALEIAAGTITANEIAATTITGNKLVAGTITATQIAASTITANEIAATTITGNKLVAGTITATQIATGTITANEIAATTITGNKLVAGTITATQIATGTITANEIAATTITGNKLVAGTITATQIATGTITANEIAATTITGNKLVAGTITATQIQGGTITANEIATNAITADKILANAVTAGKINTNAVTTNTIAANAIVSAKIAANAIIADKIAANAISVGKLISNSSLTFDGANFQFELGTSTSIGGYTGAGIFRTQKNGGFGIGGIGAQANSFAIAGQQVSTAGHAGAFVNSPAAGSTNHRTEAFLASGTQAGTFLHTSTGHRANVGTDNHALDATGPVRVTGDLVVTGNVSAANITGGGGGGTGNVSSVAFSAGTTGFTVSGSPITTSGTITLAGTLNVTNGGTGVTTSTGTGSVVRSTSPALVTPALGTPSSATLTNATGLPIVAGTTGTLSVARGGTGTTNPALAAGTGISVSGSWPNQTITSTVSGGVTSVSGTGSVNGITLSGTVTSSGSLTLGGTLGIAATQVTSGTFADARIPNLNASKITVGTFADARIPNLNASKITAGILTVARGGTGVTTSTGTGSVVRSSSPQLTSPNIGAATGSSLSVTGDVTAFASDARLKNFTGVIDNALSRVQQLTGYHFQFNQTAADLGYDPDIQYVGVSAQEVQAVMPEVVKPAPISDQYLTVQYDKLVPLLIEAIKELADQVEQLRGKA